MKRIIFTAILVFVLCFAVFAQYKNRNPPNIDFTYFSKMTWEKEKAVLDNFFIFFSENKGNEGLIDLQFDKKSFINERIDRIKRIIKYIDFRNINKKRILFRISEADTEETFYVLDVKEFEWLKEEDENHKLIKADEFEQKINDIFPVVPISDPDGMFTGKMSWEEEKMRLDVFATGLYKEKDAVGFIILKIDKQTSQTQLKNRLKRIIYYLTGTYKVERNRIRLVLQDFDRENTMYWIVPKTEVPDCENCLIVSTDDKFKKITDFFNDNK